MIRKLLARLAFHRRLLWLRWKNERLGRYLYKQNPHLDLLALQSFNLKTSAYLTRPNSY